MDFFIKYKTVILRSIGMFMLIVGFVAFFWTRPQEGMTANELAAANVARMEAKVSGKSSAQTAAKPNDAKFLEEFKKTRDDQLKYLLIIMMVAGVGFLLYSFLSKEEKE